MKHYTVADILPTLRPYALEISADAAAASAMAFISAPTLRPYGGAALAAIDLKAQPATGPALDTPPAASLSQPQHDQASQGIALFQLPHDQAAGILLAQG